MWFLRKRKKRWSKRGGEINHQVPISFFLTISLRKPFDEITLQPIYVRYLSMIKRVEEIIIVEGHHFSSTITELQLLAASRVNRSDKGYLECQRDQSNTEFVRCEISVKGKVSRRAATVAFRRVSFRVVFFRWCKVKANQLAARFNFKIEHCACSLSERNKLIVRRQYTFCRFNVRTGISRSAIFAVAEFFRISKIGILKLFDYNSIFLRCNNRYQTGRAVI